MKIKTSELTGKALDLAVSMVVENSRRFPIWLDGKPMSYATYSTNWVHGGPIIEREKITWDGMAARIFVPERNCSICVYGPTPLIAAMRCYVASKCGDEIELLEEIL